MGVLSFDPHIGVDKTGRPIRYQVVSWDERPALIDFYTAFEPKAAYQSLPPNVNRVEEWIDGLLGQWFNLGAFHRGQLIGHGALDAVAEGAVCEYLVFVAPEHQNHGIGTALTQYAVKLACWARCRKIWLIVQNSNLRAIKVYRRVGFDFTGPFADEREMVLFLNRCEDR